MPLPPLARSLSAKLLVLTVLFVMLAEVLIFTPSIARFRLAFLQERLAAAHIAALSVDAAPDRMVTRRLEATLLDHVGAHAIALVQPNSCVNMLSSRMPPMVDAVMDLREATTASLITDAFATMARAGNRVVKVVDHSPKDPAVTVEVTMDERPLAMAMHEFAGRILALSIAISLITAGLVFVTLNGMFVRPLRRLTAAMMAFRRDPESAVPAFSAAGRRDEIGIAQRELAEMQAALRTALRQRERLAALGTAVTKINHDLRGILATASLLSEHLAASTDPEVRRVTPRLVGAIDRAVALCGQTLSYTRDGVLPVAPAPLDLHALVAEAAEEVAHSLRSDGVRVETRWVNRVPEGFRVTADRDQLARVLTNLGRNAVQAGAGAVTVAVEPNGARVAILVTDTGPGLPPRARENLFQPFTGSARAGGTGLGLSIAREIARAHGGDLTLVESTAAGTTFALDLPANSAH
ncbi:sensor histidine kinase [Azospirillum halopraeferens]|uniref:sensor histidine kinase n=1 Tax=Azospirillum halopraeferens TaxID=34010 RepID=UPI00048AAEA4|nr:HAMP domain-containing sensor histidine kinase [Azospirillum halopraeferens]